MKWLSCAVVRTMVRHSIYIFITDILNSVGGFMFPTFLAVYFLVFLVPGFRFLVVLFSSTRLGYFLDEIH